jgi:hypothetical protein
VGYRGPVQLNAIIVKIQELLPDELVVIVGDDGVRDPKMENNVLDKIHCLRGADLSQWPCLNPLSELVDRNKPVGQAPRRFLEEPQKVQTLHGKQTCNGDGLEILGQCVDLSCKVLAPSVGPYDLSRVTDGRRPVKTLSDFLSNHAS